MRKSYSTVILPNIRVISKPSDEVLTENVFNKATTEKMDHDPSIEDIHALKSSSF